VRSLLRRPASPLAEGIVLGVAAMAVYLLTRTRDVGGDGTVFASAVDNWLRGRPEWSLLFLPHHPVYNPLVAAVSWIARALGTRPLVLDVGAGVSAAAAAFALGATVVLLRRAGVREGVALLAATALALAGGFWAYATRMEVYTLAAAAVVLWLAAVGRERARAVPVGTALCLAVLAHAATGLLAIPTALRMRRRPRELSLALLIGIGVPTLLIISSFVLLEGRMTPLAWSAGFFTGAEYLEPARVGSVPQALRGLLLWGFYHSAPVLRPAAVLWMDRLGALALVLAAALLALGVVSAVRRRNPLALTALLALLAYLPLWLVWDVGNVEHVVAAAPLFAVLLGFGANEIPRRGGAGLLAATAALLVVVNGVASALPQSRPQNGRVWVVASFVQRHLPLDAVILSSGRDARLRLGLEYLSGRRVVDLTLAVSSARQHGLPPAAALAYWLQGAASARHPWAMGDVFEPQTAAWVEKIGLTSKQWDGALAHLHPGPAIPLRGDAALVAGPVSFRPISFR